MSFWQLTEPPFESIIKPTFFYESQVHAEGLARLLYIVSDGAMGMAALTGEIGAGKSMLLSVLDTNLDQNQHHVVKINTCFPDFNSVLNDILWHLITHQTAFKNPFNNAVELPKTTYEKIKLFEQLLDVYLEQQQKKLIILLDEAHVLTQDALEEIKFLTNYNNQYQTRVSIVLVGQPQLKNNLKTLPEVYQRFGMFYHLTHLTKNETWQYIQHRLQIAGATAPDIFNDNCLDALFDYSNGCPRRINHISKLALHRTQLLEELQVSKDTINMIIQDVCTHFG